MPSKARPVVAGEETRMQLSLQRERKWLSIHVQLGMGRPSAKQQLQSTNSNSVPLEEFHLFPDMPPEIRLKVYQYTMIQQRRLIELEWGPNLSIPTELGNGSHHWVRVCPRSRQPPALMHVCHESREEAQKVYQLRCFDSQMAQHLPNNPELHEHYIWYNPKTDIIFFGEETCVSTYISVFSPDIEDIPAIAIVNSGKGESCCDHDDYTYGVEGGVDTLQALHGFDSSETVHDFRYGGCPGLREVFVVVKSKLWPYKQGEIDASMTVRPATNDGLTKGQARFKARLERDIARVDAEITMPGVGEIIWIDDKKPTFKFVSFAKAAWGVDPREPDGMTVSRKDLGKLRRGDWGFMKRTQANTRCEIFVPDEEYPGEDPREIGFWGVRKSIDVAKKAIEERLVGRLIP
jgi:hypothetical protein